MKCILCGKRVNPNKGNFVLLDNDKPAHKKCPCKNEKHKMTKEESASYKKLLSKIKYYATEKPMGILKERPMNFAYATKIVKEMHDRGFSYDEILYSLDKVVDMQGGFWGVGAVNNRIDCIIERKRKINEFTSKQHNIVKQQPMPMDLSKLMDEESEDW